MIRIQLVSKGRVVKQISSRLHEGIVLEQVKQFKDPFDTVVVVEGELSEAGQGILHHVAKKIIPAAMAAGLAMGGAQAQNRHPGTEYSVGQHISDIFSPNYKELVRQREAERETQRRVYNAKQGEIRRAETDRARQDTRRAYGMPADGRGMKVYDQARMSQDGKYLILYDMDNRITRISGRDLEFMDGDGQRLPHYISASGQAYYVRHPHMAGVRNEGLGEGFGTIGTTGTISTRTGNGNIPNMGNSSSSAPKPQFDKTGGTTNVTFNKNGQLELDDDEELGDENIATLRQAGIEVKEAEYRMDPELAKIIAGNKEAVEHFKAGGELSQDLETDLHFHYYNRLSYKAQRDADDDNEIGLLFAEDLGIDFNEGVEVKEAEYRMDPELVKIIAGHKQDVEHFKAGGELSQDLETALHYHYYDRLSGQAQRDADDDGEIGQLFAEDLGIDLNEGLIMDPELEAILDQYADSFKQFKAGGDLDDNPEFYEALFNYYLDSGEMPYGVAKAREGDPVQWIANKLDREAGGMAPVVEADDEATPADQASADKNIIMQIRRQADYDKPQPMTLADGSSVTISSKTANKILSKFNQLKPESKALMQQTLSNGEGFREMLNYFNERELTTEAGASATQYSSLADAYPEGSTEVWYWNDEAGRDMMMGANWLTKKGQMPTPETLEQTHVKIGSLRETNPDKVFSMMQGENWSPQGEARDMVSNSNTGHTSMSVGDIMKVGSTYLMVDRFGFHDISKQPAEESIGLSTHMKPVSEAQAMATQFMKSVLRKWKLTK